MPNPNNTPAKSKSFTPSSPFKSPSERTGNTCIFTNLVIRREWKNDDTLSLTFDMSLRTWVSEREKANLVSLHRGPLLLAYDQRFNPMDPDEVPTLDARNLSSSSGWNSTWHRILLLLFLHAMGIFFHAMEWLFHPME